MPNYETHLGFGSVFGVYAGAMYWKIFEVIIVPPYVIAGALFVAGAFALGSVLPDIDLHNSKPRKLLNFYTVIGLGGLAAYLTATNLSGNGVEATNRWAAAAAIAVFVIILAAAIVPPVVQAVMPSHRGIVHSPLLWLIGLGYPAVRIWNDTLAIPGASPVVDRALLAPCMLAVALGAVLHICLDLFGTSIGGISGNRRRPQSRW